jgi:hypothetical protein
MKSYEIFACFCAVVLLGLAAPAKAEVPNEKGEPDFTSEAIRDFIIEAAHSGEIILDEQEDVFIQIPLKNEGSSMPSVLLGPCQWSVSGKRINHARDRFKTQEVARVLVAGKNKRDLGFEVSFNCRENDGRYELSIGLGENRTDPYLFNDAMEIDRDDRSVFIMFKKKVN